MINDILLRAYVQTIITCKVH